MNCAGRGVNSSLLLISQFGCGYAQDLTGEESLSRNKRKPARDICPANPKTLSRSRSAKHPHTHTNLSLPAPFFQVGATVRDPLFPFGTSQAQAQLDCVSALQAGSNKDGLVKTCSEHTYQYSVCDPGRTAVATLPNLVGDILLSELSSLTFTIGQPYEACDVCPDFLSSPPHLSSESDLNLIM